jgi:hypothetical protein
MSEKPLLPKSNDTANYGAIEEERPEPAGWLAWLRCGYENILTKPTIKDLAYHVRIIFFVICMLVISDIFILLGISVMKRHAMFVKEPIKFPTLLIDADQTLDQAIRLPYDVLRKVK